MTHDGYTAMAKTNHPKKRHVRRTKRVADSMTSPMPEKEAPIQEKKNWLDAIRKPKVLIPAAAFILLYAAFNVWLFFYGPKVFDQGKKPTAIGNFATKMALVKPKELIKKSSPSPPPDHPAPTITPTPIKLKPDDGAKGTFSVSQGDHKGPTIYKVVFDPLDVQKGQVLVITVILKSDNDISEVKGTLQTDHSQTKCTFKRINSTGVSGEWQTRIPLKDTVLYKYILTITATSSNGTNSVVVSPRS